MPTSNLTALFAVSGAVASSDPRHVVVVLPDRCPADQQIVVSEVARHVHGHFVPYPIYPLRRTVRCLRRRGPSASWAVTRRPDGVTGAAGGARQILDLQGLAATAE